MRGCLPPRFGQWRKPLLATAIAVWWGVLGCVRWDGRLHSHSASFNLHQCTQWCGGQAKATLMQLKQWGVQRWGTEWWVLMVLSDEAGRRWLHLIRAQSLSPCRSLHVLATPQRFLYLQASGDFMLVINLFLIAIRWSSRSWTLLSFQNQHSSQAKNF